uniref:DNA (cytosine-5)-methyltransferase n=1 Tax=Ascobolus immersus TaxID=5191 RepID=O42803_ASCIM|nr:DNA-C5-methyltransferase [Ascobolus immersus]
MELTPELSGVSTDLGGGGSIFAHWRMKEESPAPTEILDDLNVLEWEKTTRDYSKEDLRIADQLFSIEDEHQSLPFETADAEDGTPTEEEEEKELPMRTLDNFVLYDASDLELAALDLIGTELNIHAVGTVGPIYTEGEEDEQEDEDEDVSPPVRTGTQATSASVTQMTVELYIRNIVQYEFCFNDDGTVETWIQTTNAHYKLLQPAKCYTSLYRPVNDCLNVITAIITLAPESTTMSLKDLLKVMDDKAQAVSYEEVERMSEFIVQHLDQWMETAPKKKSKLIEKSKVYIDLNNLAGIDMVSGVRPPPVRRVTGRSSAPKKRIVRNMNDAVLLHQNETTVTNWIHQLSAGMFGRALNVLGAETADVENLTCDPASAKFVVPQRRLHKRLKWETRGHIPVSEEEYKHIYQGKKYAKFFEAVRAVDESKLTIKLGDLVYVLDQDPKVTQTQFATAGREGRKKGAEKEKIQVRFGRVLSIRQPDSNSKDAQNVFIHVQWLVLGCDTILQEMASRRELFLTDSCDTVFADVIYGVAKLTPLGAKDIPTVEFHESMATMMGENEFFVRFKYNYQDGSFTDLKDVDAEQIGTPQPRVNTHRNPGYCSNCRIKYDNERTGDKWIYENDTEGEPRLFRSSKGWCIYAQEFVYLQPVEKQPGTTFRVGYISEINKSSVIVELLARVDDDDKSGHISYSDPRHLYFTGTDIKVTFDKIIRKCFVFHDSGDQKAKAALMYGTLQRDLYYYRYEKRKGKAELVPVREIRSIHEQTLNDWESRTQIERHGAVSGKKLKGLDIFAGCGGLTLGLDLSGAVDTKWAIEFAPSAANTLALNFPDAQVFNQCANVLLSRAIQSEDEGSLDIEYDLQGRVLPDLPKKGEVDFIYGGPPCQGFSGVNRYKKGNDIKNSLVATFLSYVDHYKPRFVLLENVKGLITTKLGNSKNAEGKWEGGISNGVVKFIYRTLISMNYQCRIGLVQSGEYGVPQSRPRVIFLAARMGERLPDLPEPMHAFEVLDSQYALPHIKRYHTTQNGVAPLPRITIGEAVSDLPKFQYANPGVWPRHDPYSSAKAQPSDKTIEKFSVSKATSFVGYLLQPYHSRPQSEFQRRLRTKLVPSDDPAEEPSLLTTKLVTAHVTRLFNKETTQRIVCVPMWPGADHRSLPKEMRPWCLVDPNSQAEKHRFWPGLFGRLGMEDFFSTALTDVQPCGKQGKVLHPTPRRVYTVRELARAQGFPDWFAFTDDDADSGLGGVKEWHRNIGNAVPVPLGEQIGRCIGYSVWWKDDMIAQLREDGADEDEEMIDGNDQWVEELNTQMAADMPGNAKEFLPARVYDKKLEGGRRRLVWAML